MKRSIVIILVSFVVGWYASLLINEISIGPQQIPFFGEDDQLSPGDRVRAKDILVYKDRVVLKIPDVEWTAYADTNSMDPLLDSGAHGLEIVPYSYKEVNPGDVIAYESNWADGLIVHRIIETGFDNDGWYSIVKGDNSRISDPGKVRFNQIKYVLIGVLY